jgi:4'-phosphopantetheinyl transferase
LTLRPDEVLLLLARPEQLLVGDARERIVALLSPHDLEHAARFRSKRDRDVALASRATQRLALSRAAAEAVRPAQWRFATDPGGRPLLESPPAAWSGLHFSAANTIGLVGCAVSLGREVGLDLERRCAALPAELLERCLSDRERAELLALPERDRPDRFTRLWTGKEAYLKARGLGIVEPLDQVEIAFGANETLALTIGPELRDDGDAWLLDCLRPTDDHFAAVCVERGASHGVVSIKQRWLAPHDERSSGARAG